MKLTHGISGILVVALFIACIARPGISLINSEGIVKAKEENYRDRPLRQDLVIAVARLVGADSP